MEAFPAVQMKGQSQESHVNRAAQMKAGVIMHLNTLPPRQHLAGISDPWVFCVMTGTCCIDAELLTLPCLVLCQGYLEVPEESDPSSPIIVTHSCRLSQAHGR